MPTPYVPSRVRRILCVYPRYAKSFGTFQHAYPLFGGRVRAFMPPQGLLVVAAYLPLSWHVRFIDENSHPATTRDFMWADAVFVSGMHVQRPHIEDLIARAHTHGRPVVLGGPSVSGCPEYYPTADILHVGELGDATDHVIEYLDTHDGRPVRQQRFETVTRLPLAAFPTPAYHLIPLRQYFIASLQYSSGCPYACEFCDIPALYGRNPRLKSPEQVLTELEALVAGGVTNVYFVDDNFIGNQKATQELLPHVVAWQMRHGYPLRFACEATLNLAKNDRVLSLMRDAGFYTVFCGIETPEADALRAMSKEQNLRLPLVEAVRRLNAYGLEVVSGIILGLDTDSPETVDHILAFIEASQIPMLTINVLYALPKTPLWRRLEHEGRLSQETGRDSNVVFRAPYETVMAGWRRCIATTYAPEAIYRRFAHQLAHTFPNRRRFPLSPHRASWRNIVWGAGILRRIIWRIGVRATYRREFWRVAGPALRSGRVEEVINIAVVASHLIEFTRECVRGTGESSFYSPTAPATRVTTPTAVA